MVKARRVAMLAAGVALAMVAAPAGVALMMKGVPAGVALMMTKAAWEVEMKQKTKARDPRCEKSAVRCLSTLKNGINGVPGLGRRDKATSRC
jgi:hypothetical protein